MSIYDVYGNEIYSSEESQELEDLIPNRVLVWHDEFIGDKIDTNKWANVFGRVYANSCYRKDTDTITDVGGGILSYRCIADNPNTEDGYKFSTTFLHTKNLFEFMYGRIEAKIKFPSSLPHHTTFWTLGANYERLSVGEYTNYDETKGVLFPSCGEIDVAEHIESGKTYGRTHYASQGLDKTENWMRGTDILLTSDLDTWHIYSAEWTESSIKFYIDGVQKGQWNTSNATVNGYNPFKIPHFLILNCIPAEDGTAPLWDIAETQVQWVRVYAPVGVTEYIAETAISIPSTASIAVGERHWLGTPTFTPANPSDMTVQWLSHNENIVTCYGGMLIGVSAGTTYVQATSKHGYSALCKVTVS